MPEWLTVPSICLVCGWPTVTDRFVDSRAGPGWACILDPRHFWQVRADRLRQLVTASPPNPYPWRNDAELMAYFHCLRSSTLQVRKEEAHVSA